MAGKTMAVMVRKDKPLSAQQYRDEVQQLLEQLRRAESALSMKVELSNLTLEDRSELMQYFHEEVVTPVTAFAHSQTADINARIRGGV